MMLMATVFGSLRGVVHDPDHRPVPGAGIVIQSTTSDYAQSLSSGLEGNIETPTLPAGAYRVTVTKEGFAAATQEVVVVSGSAPRTPLSIVHWRHAADRGRQRDNARRGCSGGERSTSPILTLTPSARARYPEASPISRPPPAATSCWTTISATRCTPGSTSIFRGMSRRVAIYTTGRGSPTDRAMCRPICGGTRPSTCPWGGRWEIESAFP